MIIVTRAEWKARQPRSRNSVSINKPSTGHWNGPTITVGGKTTWDHSRCASLVRGIQNFHMDGRGWIDIAYNFLICPHGSVFEGRGLNVINAANGVTLANRTSHAIMFLAGKDNTFSIVEKTAYRASVKYISDKTNAPDESVGHRDHKSTECPGEERYIWISQGMQVSGSISTPDKELDEEDIYMALAKDIADARNTWVREQCLNAWGFQPSVAEQQYYSKQIEKNGLDLTLAEITGHSRASALRVKRGW